MDQQINYQYNSDYRPPPQPPSVRDTSINYGVLGIIATCVAMLAWMYIDLDSTAFLWMWPDANFRVWQFVTSIFMHGGFSHLFWNMFMLYMFGMALENRIGTGKFLALFIAAGIVGNIGYVAFCILTGSDVPAVGASGALYGIFACLAIMLPNMKVYFFFMIPMKIIHALLFYAAVDIVFMNSNDNVAHAAHIAGLVAGLVFGLYLKNKQQKSQTQASYKQQHNAPYR